MTDIYLVTVENDGDVFASRIEAPDTELLRLAATFATVTAHDNQGADNMSKAAAAQEVIAQIMPELGEGDEEDDDEDEEEEYGWIVISEMVTDGSETWLETQRYLYYSPDEARARFEQHVKDKGWEMSND